MEAKELLDFMGIEAANLDEFKEKFSPKYFTEKQVFDNKDLLGKFTGKTMGKIKQTMLKEARESEIPFTNNEFDESDIETVFKTLKTRQADHFTNQLAEVKSQIGKSGEDAIAPYKEKLTKFEQALADEKKAKQDIMAEYEGYKSTSAGVIKNTRIDYFKKDLMTSIPYDPTAMKDELKRKGWESHVSENFKFDFDETDQPVILDKSGAKIKNPQKADQWLTPKEVLTAEADKLGLIPKNPQGGRPAFTPPNPGAPPPAAQPANNANPKRKLAPGMEQYLTK